jgi:iron complex transport system ATP-binding protein
MSHPLLVCRDVDICYGERCLVRGLSLDVNVGERWAVVGPNGAGKSSLLLVLAGARRPDHGRIELDGKLISDWGVEQLAALRAMVADRWIDPFAMDVLETVKAARYRMQFRAGLDARAGRADGSERAARVAQECLQAMDCADLAMRDIRRLSRGERQRVALAAALAQESALVLLDEPISHQDPKHQMLVLQNLKERSHSTFIAALHDINAGARFATHALLLAGDGNWQAGVAREVLTCVGLSALFDTEIVQLELGMHRVFVAAGEAID